MGREGECHAFVAREAFLYGISRRLAPLLGLDPRRSLYRNGWARYEQAVQL